MARPEAPWGMDERDTEATATVDGPPPLLSTDLPPGTQVGRYVVLQQLGFGGMGAVYAAYDAELDRRVALKFLRHRTTQADAEEWRARMMREAKAMARLSHPNVVTIYDVGLANDGRVFLAIEVVDGGTLEEWLEAAPRSWREVVRILCEAGEGLAAAHAAGMIHRDFKLANVLFGKDGRPRVTDFGLARTAEEAASEERHVGAIPALGGEASGQRFVPLSPNSSGSLPRLTLTGSLMGTPGYMAPEQYTRPDRDRGRAGRTSSGSRRRSTGRCTTSAPFEEARSKRSPARPSRGRCATRRRGAPSPPGCTRSCSGGSPRSAPIALRRWRSSSPRCGPTLGARGDAGSRRERSWWRRSERGSPYARQASAARASVARWPIGSAGYGTRRGRRRSPRRSAASGLAYAEDTTWGRVEKRLDAYATAWSRSTQDACTATRIRGEQSEPMLDLRTACLDERLDDLRALSDVLASADAKTVGKAAQAANALESIEPCANVDRLSVAGRLPPELAARAQIRAIQAGGRDRTRASRDGQGDAVLARSSRATP